MLWENESKKRAKLQENKGENKGNYGQKKGRRLGMQSEAAAFMA
jgi:hypothetical protein